MCQFTSAHFKEIYRALKPIFMTAIRKEYNFKAIGYRPLYVCENINRRHHKLCKSSYAL